ncbi:restriction endonuclease subunit S [Micromonospora sp. 4G57]|uniref:Restriction endonuclease subunit S n=2 Tax=Micromonospora sicca TaxID=2202420 RepID=A0ABU5JN32_9ACTN|nr:restriction endonuclease subunit S [Micromonospora sp. 4G57]MDZ5447386.1 restriction endonuclease subunit S [Micromonospora sp. 4G57]MDZ5494049.1 restriction endonuclease subunit S [Micromonospora sp. 4G53]
MRFQETPAEAGLRRLQYLADVAAGPSGSLLGNLSNRPDGVPVLSPQDLGDGPYGVRENELRRVPWADYQKLGRFTLQEDDLVLVRQGSIGRLALVTAKQSGWLYGSSCLRVRPNQELVSAPFLAYYLSHPPVQKSLLERALPGTVPSLNTQVLNEFPVAVPPLKRQLQIVGTMTALEDSIAAQHAIVERLKSLRPAVLDELMRKPQQHAYRNG